MNCQQLRVAFAGTPEFAAVALDALISSDHEVVGVLTQPDRPAGRGRKLTPGAVKQRALTADIQVQQPTSLKNADAVAAFAAWQPDVLVVAAYGLLLPQSVLDIPALGCLNIHGSLLPRWRGAAPIHRAILAGDNETGVCIMQMDAGLDTGPVFLEERLDILPDETVAQLHDRLAELGASTLLKALPGVCDGSLSPAVQLTTGITYAEKLTKAEASLDFSESSLQLHRRIRAYNPWPVATAMLAGQRVRIWRSQLVTDAALNATTAPPGTILSITDNALRVKTGDGAIDLLSLQWPGKQAVDAISFAHNKNLPGQGFQML